MSCFQNLIGLARCACPCTIEDAPLNYNQSPSGLFVGDLIEPDLLGSFSTCDEGSAWSLMVSARQQAATELEGVLSARLAARSQPIRPAFTGSLAQMKNRSHTPPNTTLSGVVVRTAPVASGVLRLTRINTNFLQSGTVTVRFVDQYQQQVASPVTLTHVGGQIITHIVDVRLPFFGPLGHRKIYIVSDGAALQPMETRISCGCGPRSHVFDASDFGHNYSGSDGWKNWIQMGGWRGAAITDIQPDTTDSCCSGIEDRSWGLSFEATISCEPIADFCTSQITQKGGAYLPIAQVSQLRTAIILVDKVLTSPNANRMAIAKNEALRTSKAEWQKEAAELLESVVDNYDLTGNDCLCHKGVYSVKSSYVYK